MAAKTQRKNLGRGLSALIPDVDMNFLSQVVRDNPNASVPLNKTKSRTRTKHPEDVLSPQLPAEKDVASTAANQDGELSPTRANFESGPSNNPTSIQDIALNTLPEIDIEADTAATIEFVALNSIVANPYQPRRFFSPDELADLVNSLREHGVLQPIILRPSSRTDSDSSEIQYQLIAGERRWRAAQTAGLNEIPAIIRPVTDQQALELALIENVQRHDISSLDAAIAYKRLSQEFSLSQEQVAQRVGKSRSSVANTIRLLDLPHEAQRAIEEGVLSEGHGRAILLTPTDGSRRAVLRQVLRDKLSVRATEELARKISDSDDISDSDTENKGKSSDDAPLKASRLSPEARRIEEGLQKHLGTRVKLKLRRQGGQILVNYFSNEELDRLLKLIMK